jgi:hypothetical protein
VRGGDGGAVSTEASPATAGTNAEEVGPMAGVAQSYVHQILNSASATAKTHF